MGVAGEIAVNRKQLSSVKAAIAFRVEEADRAVANRLAKVSAASVASSGGRNSNNVLRLAQEIGQIGDDLVAELKALYTFERSRLLRDHSDLRGEIVGGLVTFYRDAERHSIYAWAGNAAIFMRALDEDRKQDLKALQDHFERPGLKSLPERFPFRFGGLTAGGLLIAALTLIPRS